MEYNENIETTAQTPTTSSEEDVYSPIKESERVNWPTMLMIFVGMWVSMYSVNIGMAVGQQMPIKSAILATVLGYAIAGVFAALIGDAGQRTGLASYVLAKIYQRKELRQRERQIRSTACL